MIFKIQIPLAGNMNQVLIYSEKGKSHLLAYATKLQKDLAPLLKGRNKIYVDAEVVNGIIQVLGEVESQNW